MKTDLGSRQSGNEAGGGPRVRDRPGWFWNKFDLMVPDQRAGFSSR